jgi:hypothetical protein
VRAAIFAVAAVLLVGGCSDDKPAAASATISPEVLKKNCADPKWKEIGPCGSGCAGRLVVADLVVPGIARSCLLLAGRAKIIERSTTVHMRSTLAVATCRRGIAVSA